MNNLEMKRAVSLGESLDLNDVARSNISGKFAPLACGNTHYEVSGNGEAVVLVHGYATPYFIYDKIFKALLDAGYKVLRYDLLGRGYSERVEKDYTPALFAEQLDEISSYVFGEEAFYLVGTSMGGTITTTFYKTHPDKVKKLVLLAPAGMDTFKPPLYMKLCKPKGLGEFIFNNVAGNLLLKKCASEMSHSTDADKDYYEKSFGEAFKYKGFLRCTLSSLRNTILNTKEAMKGYHAVAENDLPVLCIWGTADKTMPYYQHERLKEVCPKAHLITYEGSGHIFLYDEGERTATDIIAFLKNNTVNLQNDKLPIKREGRHLGMDLLRIIAIFMVVLGHLNTFGGIFGCVEAFSPSWYATNFLGRLSNAGVNLFALISGFCNYGKKFKIKNILNLWIQMVFYTFIITLLVYCVRIGKENALQPDVFIQVFTPASTGNWFFSSYFLLFFVMPFINIAMEKMSHKFSFCLCTAILLSSVVVYFVGSHIGGADAFSLRNGYSFAWLLVLYISGAYFKKYNPTIRIKGKELNAWLYLILFFVFLAVGIGMTVLLTKKESTINGYAYTFFATVLMALSLFAFSTKIKKQSPKIISKMASASFGVFILHSNTYIIAKLLVVIPGFIDANFLVIILFMIAYSLAVHFGCIIVDWIRQWLFRVIGLNRLLNLVQNKFDTFTDTAKNNKQSITQ